MGNNNNFRHLSDGINLVPNATTEVTNPGDIDYSSNNGEFNFFTGSGIDQIAGVNSTQTLTNKTLSVGPSGPNFIIGPTAGTAAQFDPTTGYLDSSITTSTELGYVHGVTSSIQAQINAITGGSSVVTSVNSLTGNINLLGSSSIQITPSGQNLTFSVNPAFPGTGTVTSVTFTGDGTVLSSTPSAPVTSSGTLTATLNTQSANTFLAGPNGSSGLPTFRDITLADLPTDIPSNILVNLYDNVDTTLPSTSSTLIDGQTIATGNLVLFSNLATGNNQVYQATVSGPSVSWMSINSPGSGNQVFVQSGNLFTDQTIVFNGTSWSLSGILGSAGYGTSGQVLTSNGATAFPTWQASGGGGGSIPTGTILSFAGPKTSIPSGYLYCDGSSYLISTYPALAAALFDSGTGNYAWGSADASHFNVPFCQGMFLRGVSDATGEDPDASDRNATNPGGNTGDNVGTSQIDQFASHSHTASVSTVADASSNSIITREGSNAGVTQFPVTVNATGGNQTNPRNVYVNYMVKT